MNNEKIHHIDDVHEFYRVLDHTDELRLNGMLAEEFVLTEYHYKTSENHKSVCKFESSTTSLGAQQYSLNDMLLNVIFGSQAA